MAEGPLRRWFCLLVIFHIAIVITDEFPRGNIFHRVPSLNPELKSEKPELESGKLELESKKTELESSPIENEVQSQRKPELEFSPIQIKRQSHKSPRSEQSPQTRVNFCATEACVQMMLEYEKTQYENGSGIYPGRFGRKK